VRISGRVFWDASASSSAAEPSIGRGTLGTRGRTGSNPVCVKGLHEGARERRSASGRSVGGGSGSDCSEVPGSGFSRPRRIEESGAVHEGRWARSRPCQATVRRKYATLCSSYPHTANASPALRARERPTSEVSVELDRDSVHRLDCSRPQRHENPGASYRPLPTVWQTGPGATGDMARTCGGSCRCAGNSARWCRRRMCE
jgi:hypothetical protein